MKFKKGRKIDKEGEKYHCRKLKCLNIPEKKRKKLQNTGKENKKKQLGKLKHSEMRKKKIKKGKKCII